MKIIMLANGGEALLDDEDFARLSHFRWLKHAMGYAYRRAVINGVDTGVYLHREVMNFPPAGLVVDHINRNKLDCRKGNLRTVMGFQNLHNTGRRVHNTSGCSGVGFNKGKWVARINVNGQHYGLGRYSDKRDAVRARALAELWFKRRLNEVHA